MTDSPKRSKPGEFAEMARSQADDLVELRRVQARQAREVAKIREDKSWSEEGRAKRIAELVAAFQPQTNALMAGMRKRSTDAAALAATWEPARRRLNAALADPERAAALRARLALVPLADLEALGKAAAEAGDDFQLDAVSSVFAAAQEKLDLSGRKEWGARFDRVLDSVDAVPRSEIAKARLEIDQAYGSGRSVAAQIAGTPITPMDRMTLGFDPHASVSGLPSNASPPPPAA